MPIHIAETYLPAHNRRFRVDAAEPGSAFVPWPRGRARRGSVPPGGPRGRLGQHRAVRKADLADPESPLRPYFVKAAVQVRRYGDATLAFFHGPRCIGRYQADGTPADIAKLAA